MAIYGYCRVSTGTQNIERQIRNIRAKYPEAVLFQDKWTGTTLERPNWKKLLRKVSGGDLIVFDSVSRMSRNAQEGIDEYMSLYNQGIELEFLNEPTINTAAYRAALEKADLRHENNGSPVKYILEGVTKFLEAIAAEQIRIAFDQSEKEVSDLHERTKQGIETARRNGKQIGHKPGTPRHTVQSDRVKAAILKYSKAFGGDLIDEDCRKIAQVSVRTYYRYKRMLLEELKGE